MSIAIIGAEGQLGSELCRQLGAETVPLDLPRFDVTDSRQVMETLSRLKPAAAVNCAAYTLVDRAEQEPDICRTVNADAVCHLADAAQRNDFVLVHISTDYVFGGDVSRETPYVEADAPAPQGVYANTKLAGERFAAAWSKSFVVRTSGLYGVTPRRNNFVETMLRLAEKRNEVRVVDDQQCSPTYVAHLARAIGFLVGTSAYGTYHVVNSGGTTWYRFAKEIFRLAHRDVTVKPITTAEFGAPAPRPAYSVLDTSRYHSLGGPPMPSWREALSEYLRVRSAEYPG